MRRVLLFLLLFVAPAAAEEPVRLSLAETLERARAHSARLRQLVAFERSAGATLRSARGARLPQVDVSASYVRNSSVPELTFALPGQTPTTIFPNIPDNYRVRAGLGVPLYTGGRLGGAVEAAARQREAAGYDLEAGGRELVLEATRAYWDLVVTRESARVLAEAVASVEAHFKDTKNMVALGMAARDDELAVQVERDRAELSRLQAANQAAVANENLLRLVGLSPGTRIEPTEPTATPSLAPEDVEALVSRAQTARPEAAALRARVLAAEAAVRVARSAWLPQASLSASYDYARPNTRILPPTDTWKSTWSVGLGLTLTPFDGGRTSAAVAQSRAQADAVRQGLEDLERRIRLEVTSRSLDLETAQASLAVAERSLEAAREGVRVERDRYREGLSPSSQLLDAETRRLRAGLDQTLATTDVQVARAGLDQAVGR